MSGEHRRVGAWLLPVIVVAIGAYFLLAARQSGALRPVELKPVNWAGLTVMAAGLVPALGKKMPWKLVGTLVCGIGAILVICA